MKLATSDTTTDKLHQDAARTLASRDCDLRRRLREHTTRLTTHDGDTTHERHAPHCRTRQRSGVLKPRPTRSPSQPVALTACERRHIAHGAWAARLSELPPPAPLTPRRVGASPSPSLSQDGAAVGRAPAMVYESSSAEPARPTGRLCSLACRPRMPASIHANHSITPVPHSRVHPLAHRRTPAGGCEGSPA